MSKSAKNTVRPDALKMMRAVLKKSSRRCARSIIAVIATILMLLLTIICDRIPYSFGNEEFVMKRMQLSDMLIGKEPKPLPDDILAVNISFDRQLTPAFDEYGLPCGETDVTDRHKLSDFLSIIKDADYKAIALDIFFNAETPAEGDTTLIQQINSMPRLFVPVHSDSHISPLINKEKQADGDYVINMITNNFSKYDFVGSSDKTPFATALYNAENPGKEAKFGLFRNSTMILPLQIPLKDSYTEDGEKVWYNLGSDLLDISTADEIKHLAKGKTIIIGDYCLNDIHDSYLGVVSGPCILINALTCLRENRNLLNPWSLLITTAIYFLIAYFLIMNLTLWRLIHWEPRPVMNFILSFIGFGFILSLLQMTHFMLFTEFHDTLFVTFFISLYSIYCQKLNKSYKI